MSVLSLISRIYGAVTYDRPAIAIALVLLTAASLGSFAPGFRLDASSDALVLENDNSLKYYRQITAKYGSDDYLVLTWTPRDNDLYSDKNLEQIGALRDRLKTARAVQSVMTILDVPLISSPPIGLADLQDDVPTLLSPRTDREMAKKELVNSPFYADLIVSRDNNTTAILAVFKRDDVWYDLLNRRNVLRETRQARSLSTEEQAELTAVSADFDKRNSANQIQLGKDIEEIRGIVEPFTAHATIHMGGVPMIAADSMSFIENDLQVFGIAVFVFIILLLAIIFRQTRWVFLPMINCGLIALSLVGFMGLMDWPVTVVSSNFISILLIITLSLTVHLTVYHREYHFRNPELDSKTLARHMVERMFVPCFFTSATTIVAFASLVVSGIRPVIDFGWMMAIGISLSFCISFLFFPAILTLLPPPKTAQDGAWTDSITGFAFNLVDRFPRGNLLAFAVIAALAVIGLGKLSVENRFIDYYKDDTEVFQGMKVIDERLGGTTPLDIILDAPAHALPAADTETAADEEEDEEDWFEDDEETGITDGFWFNGYMLEDIARVHDYLDSLPETGKVLSLHTAMQMLRQLDPETEIDTIYLAVLYNKIPEDLRTILLSPYISEDGNQLRFSVRVHESDYGLRRQELINKIHHDLGAMDSPELENGQVNTTGMLVLYNNLLQSLFNSQILTVGFVFAAVLAMFIWSFRNLRMALLAILPNILAASTVLGLMGWAGIPLDIMTITIAAICIGIAVDDTIHYVHRFAREFAKDRNYPAAAARAHGSIGHAMYYTTVTITFGFSVMVFSNFVPTIYFGLLTGLSMVVALIANLVLLPGLILLIKPYGKEN